jgi:hypothetical protein
MVVAEYHQGDTVAGPVPDEPCRSLARGEVTLNRGVQQVKERGGVPSKFVIFMEVDDRISKYPEGEHSSVMIGELFPTGWDALITLDSIPAPPVDVLTHGLF